jgi:hypothetical protein
MADREPWSGVFAAVCPSRSWYTAVGRGVTGAAAIQSAARVEQLVEDSAESKNPNPGGVKMYVRQEFDAHGIGVARQSESAMSAPIYQVSDSVAHSELLEEGKSR